MKKFIFSALLMCICFVSFGQGFVSMTPYNAAFTKLNVPDTTTNTDTTYLVVSTVGIQDYDINIEATNTRVSGTVGGSIIVQGANTFSASAYWTTLKTDKTQDVSVTDTVTATNGNTTFKFNIKAYQYKYIRVRYISSGTQRSTLTGTLFWCPTLIKNLN